VRRTIAAGVPAYELSSVVTVLAEFRRPGQGPRGIDAAQASALGITLEDYRQQGLGSIPFAVAWPAILSARHLSGWHTGARQWVATQLNMAWAFTPDAFAGRCHRLCTAPGISAPATKSVHAAKREELQTHAQGFR